MTLKELAKAAEAAQKAAWINAWACAYDTEIAKSAVLNAQTIDEWAAAKDILTHAKIAESVAWKLKEQQTEKPE